MKKKIQFLAFLFVIVLGGYNFYSAQNINACSDLLLQEIGALARGEGSESSCKWKRIDCPGWGTGDYAACLTSGDGNSCTCGTITRDCE